MAFTERYVTTTGAGAHDGTSEANAWSFAEMIAAPVAAGQRVNIKSDAGYSIGATTVPNGTAAAPIVLRGYSSTIGDLDNLGRNADGTLNTTGMPDITMTGLMTPGTWVVFQNLDVTGALSGYLFGNTAVDFWGAISCNFVNTQNNAAAGCCQQDNDCFAINCDMYCSGAAHSIVCDADLRFTAIQCRFRTVDTDAALFFQGGTVVNCLFYGSATGIAIDCGLSTEVPPVIFGNTIYGMGTAYRHINAVNIGWFYFLNNHITDCSTGRNSQYSGTANVAAIFANNRTRDVTTLNTGFEDVLLGAVTTDGGGAETDYTDAASGNFRLISTAPGKATGMTPYMDIGAYQREEAGAGGGLLTHPGYSGRV